LASMRLRSLGAQALGRRTAAKVDGLIRGCHCRHSHWEESADTVFSITFAEASAGSFGIALPLPHPSPIFLYTRARERKRGCPSFDARPLEAAKAEEVEEDLPNEPQLKKRRTEEEVNHRSMLPEEIILVLFGME